MFSDLVAHKALVIVITPHQNAPKPAPVVHLRTLLVRAHFPDSLNIHKNQIVKTFSVAQPS